MSSQTVNSSGASADGIVGINSPSCFPCESSASASSTTSAMQIDVPQSERGCDAATRMPPQCPQRQPQTGPTNVGELVTKAKKAAASLWMILHAQNCRLANDSCPHRGCSQTKRLLIHVKSCPAGPNFPCPTQCQGCKETRKLLAHYRRCKDMRMKQVGLGRRSGLQPDQSCLVCSLMARYAKSMLDRSSKNSAQGKNTAASLSLLSSAASLLSSSSDGKFNVERGLANFNHQARVSSPVERPNLGPKRTSSMILMPPTPPRSALFHHHPQ